MKFSNGCWLMQEGVECFSPKEIYELRREEHAVTLLAPTSPIRHRGDTLGGIVLHVRITAPAPEVLRVQAWHHQGVRERGPAFALSVPGAPLEVEEDDSSLRIASGSVSLTIDKASFRMEFWQNGRLLTTSEGRDLGFIKTNWKGFAYDKGDRGDTYFRQQLSLSVGELVYGLGERFTPFVKNGQSIDIWNEDGGTSTQQSYKNIPFYVTNRGYGIFVNDPGRVSMEIGSEMVGKAGFSVPGEVLDYFVIGGPSMKEVLTRYTVLTGKPALPPAWSFGLWLSTSFTTSYDEATVMQFVDGMEEREIPLRVFHFDCFWMRDFHWSDFLWDTRTFPDAPGLLARLKEKGLKICVWINPYIAQASALFDEGARNGYFLRRPNGDVWQWDMWQPGMAVVDFTNPAAKDWFCAKLEALLDMGVDCFKTDFGERIPTDVVYADGSDPMKMHNYYTHLYNEAVFALLKRHQGEGEAVLFARSATAGGQQFPVHWGGDCWSTYESMAESLRGGLSLAMSGFGFWSHDIGGFESTSTADVYKRWAAFGLLSSHSRLHGSTSYRVPWVYDDEAVAVVRFFTRLKARLMPYLFAQACATTRTGIPMLRSMVLEFPEDRTCETLDRQYMMGDNLLVAPLFRDDFLAEYYLPAGKWTHLLTGECVSGGGWRKEAFGYESLPLFVRENSILALGSVDSRADYEYAENVELRVYALSSEASACVTDLRGETTLTVSAKREGNVIRMTLDASKPCTIRLMNASAIGAEGASFQQEGTDTVLMPQEGARQILCSMEG